MKVDVRLTAEQIAAEAGFPDRLARFQIRCDKLERDIREKFRLCLHEGGHAMYFRRFGHDVCLHGPHFKYDGRVRSVLGAVSPIKRTHFCDWKDAAVFMAGFMVVERFTGTPEDEDVVDNDLELLKRKLEASPRLPSEPEEISKRLDRAQFLAEFAVDQDMQEPQFLRDLEQATRDYEKQVFDTDETWDWAAKEYRFDLPLWWKRYSVGLSALGYFGLLIDDGQRTRLFFEGKEYGPGDRVLRAPLETHVFEPSRKGAAEVVQRWNEAVHATSQVPTFR